MPGEVADEDVVLVLDAEGGAVVLAAVAEGRVPVSSVLHQDHRLTLVRIRCPAKFVRYRL